jgi:preprotein translocase subunit SecG
MTSTLFIVQIVLAVLITISVLMQKSSSIGLGAYSGSNESVFGAKGPAGFLTKLTFTLGLLFVANTLALGYFYSQESQSSVIDTIKKDANSTKSVPAAAVPFAPTEKKTATAPAAPAAPKAPESNNSK